MSRTTKPLPFDQLESKPPLPAQIQVSDDVQQTLALLSGYDGSQRKLLAVSPTGILYASSPRVRGTINVLADQASYNYQGDLLKTTEVLVKAHPDNAGRVWVNIDLAAAPDTGWPLDAGDWLNVTVTNLKSLHVHIVADTEKAIVIYSE